MLDVSFIFGGISSEYGASISSLTHIISSLLSHSNAERPFSVKHMYHVSRHDSLVRTIPFHSAITISELQTYIFDTSILPGRTLLASFDTIEPCKEYVVNLLSGQFGEDGGVQTLAALSGLRGTFGDPQVASLTMNKYAMSSFVSALLPAEVVKVPKTKLIKPRHLDDVTRSLTSYQGQIVVKPNSLGTSLFTQLFDNIAASHTDISALLRKIFRYDGTALLQEFIPGDEYSCGCIILSSEVIMLPVVKVKTEKNFFGHNEKNSRGAAENVIVDRDDAMSERVKSITRAIVSAIDICGMARLDFKIGEQSEIYFLECNCIPALGEDSIFAKML
ncbi:ATP-grasp domain-containing protein, partial [Mesorhizobium sp.]|uniref:ATP-grasp domain-containing protein n=1 Tax=Mesorhizobium sp. TaxID=1871066 RepID=UPI0025CFEA88